MVTWPPLYSALLALVAVIFHTDPLLVASGLNAILFGLIVYLGGVLTFRHLPSSPVLALIGAVSILIATPLFSISVMAWSEPLFILFALLSLIFAESYLSTQTTTWLLLLSSSVALASLTRYIGLALILWGVLLILLFCRARPRTRTAHVLLFVLVSTVPLGLWLMRNHAVSGTLLGLRTSSVHALPENLSLTVKVMARWYRVPGVFLDGTPPMILAAALVCLLAVFGLRARSSHAGTGRPRNLGPLVLLPACYIGFLIIASTTATLDAIDDRLLAPAYVPLTVVAFVMMQAMAEPSRKKLAGGRVKPLLLVALVVWVVYPLRTVLPEARRLVEHGQGYSGSQWIENKTIRYLLEHRTLQSECTFYTNGPEVAYIHAGLVTKISPVTTSRSALQVANDIARLRGSWPGEPRACLVWFDGIERQALLTIDELRDIADLDPIAECDDGTIYAVTRKIPGKR
jgi:hypothetical protein